MKAKPGLVGIICGLAATLPLFAQKGDLQLEVAPQAVEVESCDVGSPLLVIARNSGAQVITSVSVGSFSDAGLTLAPGEALRVLPAHGEFSWQLQVKCGAEFASGHLQIVLHGKNAAGKVEQVLTQAVAVKLREPRSLDTLATIDVKSGLESLHAGDHGTLYLVLTNKTAKPIGTRITPQQPDMTFAPENTSVQVAPLSSQIVSFTAEAKNRLTPGKKLLFFTVNLSIGGEERTFLASREIEVGILGESEILKLLGVPSLFFLPGFLAVSAFQLLWRWKLWFPGAPETVLLEEGKSGFWVVSITASLVITGGFLLFGRRDFFTYYGLGDLMILWFVSLGLGVAVYAVYRGIENWQQRERYPQPGDSQWTILRKLKQYNKSIDLDEVKVKGSSDRLFLLLTEGDSAYVCPQMQITWRDTADAGLRERVEEQLTTGGDPGLVAELCEEEMAKEPPASRGIGEVKWIGTDSLHPSAHKVALSEVETRNGKRDSVLVSVDL